MKTICFATNNQNKINEISQQLHGAYQLLGLKEIGCLDTLPETRNTLEGNSAQKAEYVWEHFQESCFADDTGLEIDALHGAPGVDSAHYAGPERDSEANMNLVLDHLKGKSHRKAQFRTVITLILDGEKHQFEGVCKGEIIQERSGDEGFGYDPIFKPEGYDRTFAQMSIEEKNNISHRGLAVKKLIKFLLQ